MTDLTKNMHETIASHFGLGSSTRGKTMDEHNKGRTEAEARAERAVKPKVRCKHGESFEAFERREFRKNYDDFLLAFETMKGRAEDANLPPAALEELKNIISDFCGDWWRADPRMEE